MSALVFDVTVNNTSSSPWPTKLGSLEVLNLSTFPDQPISELASENDPWEVTSKALIGTLLSLVILASIGGNFLVCLAIYSDRRLRKLGNLFLVSLALADLFVAALVETFALANDLMNRWVFGPQFCDTWIAFDVMCCTASILNLCAISLDRFVHIKDPLRYGRWMTRRVVLGSVAAIWLMSALVSFLPISLGWHKPKKPNPTDELQQCALDLTPTYAVVSSCISFYLPCLVMIALYSRLYLYAKKHVKSIRAVTKPPLINGRTSGSSSSGSTSHQSMDHKAAITLGFIMGSFLVCWVPFFCVNVVEAYCKSCVSELTFKCLTWLGYLNSALNPIIYSIFNTEFRDAFRRILIAYVKGDCCRTNPADDFRRDSGLTCGARWNQRRRSTTPQTGEQAALRIAAPGDSSGAGTEI